MAIPTTDDTLYLHLQLPESVMAGWLAALYLTTLFVTSISMC